MARENMDQVRAEIGHIWPEAVELIGSGRPPYNRKNLETWLLNWHLFCQEADHRFAWAQMRADIMQAIKQAEPRVQEFFELYCVIGFDMSEIASIFDCQVDTCRRYWFHLMRLVRRTLLDDTIYQCERPNVKVSPGRDSCSEPWWAAWPAPHVSVHSEK